MTSIQSLTSKTKQIKPLAFHLAAPLSTLFYRQTMGTELWVAGLHEAGTLGKSGFLKEAEATYMWLLQELPPKKAASIELARIHNGLAEIYEKRLEVERAAAAFDQALQILYTLPATVPFVLNEMIRSISGVAELLLEAGNTLGAEKVLRQSLVVLKQLSGHESPTTLAAMQSLAQVLHMRGDLDEATTLLSSVSQAQIRLLGREHEDTQATLQKLTELLVEQGKNTQAHVLMHQTPVNA